jgi:Zn-dependent protease with chaperone function
MAFLAALTCFLVSVQSVARPYSADSSNTTERDTPLFETAFTGLLVWACGLVLLLGLGMILSKLTLATAAKPPTSAEAHVQGMERFLRQTYRLVLWVCCAYYYISLPIVALVVLGAGGGIIYGFLALGQIPIKLVLVVGFFTVVSIWSVIKSIFVSTSSKDPGEKIDITSHPKFQTVLLEVAKRIGTRPVDRVYLTPTTDVAVFERGGLFEQLTGRTERCLVLGVGVLDGFPIGAFKAVLAHEYGHFRNEDTAGGGFALAVRRSILLMAISLAQSGAATWYNPAWLFVSGFHKVFARISQGASRLQEILADRWAAFGYGADAFKQGLTHVIERSIRFDAHTQIALAEVIESKVALTNLYRYEVKGERPPEKQIKKAIKEVLTAEPSPYDSHPSPAERFALIAALPKCKLDTTPDDELDAWELFADRKALEKQMTRKIREAVETNHGVYIPAAKPKTAKTKAPTSTGTDE